MENFVYHKGIIVESFDMNDFEPQDKQYFTKLFFLLLFSNHYLKILEKYHKLNLNSIYKMSNITG